MTKQKPFDLALALANTMNSFATVITYPSAIRPRQVDRMVLKGNPTYNADKAAHMHGTADPLHEAHAVATIAAHVAKSAVDDVLARLREVANVEHTEGDLQTASRLFTLIDEVRADYEGTTDAASSVQVQGTV